MTASAVGTTAPPHTVWQGLSHPRFLLSLWPWRALLHLLISAVLGVVLLPLIGLALIFVPLLALAIGAMERRRTRLLGFPRQASGHARVPRGERHHWLNIRLTESATWREAAALAVDLVLGLQALVLLFFEAALLIVFGGVAIVGMHRVATVNLFAEVHVEVGPATWWLLIPIAVVALAVFGYLNALFAGGHAVLLRLLCGPRSKELARNVERLTRSRATLLAAFETERRRIERDLHDGVQQELVALAARLGMAELELEELARRGTETGELRAALDAARDQADHALATLRNTVRGIHPAVLTDHGLAAALGDLAHRATVQLELALDGLPRVTPAAETAAYYLVTEAIANAAKHTVATRVRVAAAFGEGLLDVTVTDDGHGGADESAGTGLRGLRERAEASGGSFGVHSPVGGPTTLRMRVPAMTVALQEEKETADAHSAR